MKFNTLTLSAALGAVFFLFTSTTRNPNNPPLARTGAPGETTCGATDCHSGGVFTGTVTISGVPDTVIYGQVYPLTIRNTSNAIRAGFQLTCLDSVNTKCGNITSATGVNVASASNRQYARQSQPKNLSAGSASWTFNWTAPATASGNKATFYFVSLCSNSNGQKTGDNVIINTKPIVLRSPLSPVLEPLAAEAVKVYPSLVSDFWHIELLNASKGRVFVYQPDGRLVLDKVLSDDRTELDVTSLTPGTYLARIEQTGGYIVKKFVKY